jgi:HNH endonuclease
MNGVRGLPKRFTEESLREYLLSRTERMPNGCLEFRGSGPRHAYQRGPGRAWAHIAAYAAFIGPIDTTLVIDHICENPPCIEPTHLRQVTRAENAARRRGKKPRGSSCTHERVIDPETGYLQKCNPCNAEAQRRWRERQMA